MARYRRVGRADEFRPGEVRRIPIDEDLAIAVVNLEGEFFAVDDMCTHDEASLSEGGLEGHTLECPRHGSRFDLRTGRPLSLPAVRPVRTFPVKVEAGDLLVDLGG